MKFNYILILASIVTVGFTSCKKVEGPGGTSSITGTLKGQFIQGSSSTAKSEVTHVTVTHANGIDGSILDNSDYFLLNTPNGGTYYYVWYENTNFPGQDPNLSGRTGIKVVYSNSESNVVIASNTVTAIESIASADFSVSRVADLITLTNLTLGEVPDADEVNTPFIVDVATQGKSVTGSSTLSSEVAIADERVYIIYGEEDFYSESVRTDESGRFQFKGLTTGDYRVYALSLDTLSLAEEMVRSELSASISEKEQVVDAGQLNIIK
ncbi:carboxypeptidase-like regulatory domain-containing protein [bacterium]|nr:carboxypeptidase-like regulatory domain-containing protein [bacterium]